MPKKLGQQFTTRRRERRYDFEQMGVTLNGEVFLLEKGSDYHCSEPAIRGHMRDYAKEHGLVFASQVRRTGKRVEGVEVAFAQRVEDLPLEGSGLKVGGVAQVQTPSVPGGEAHRGDSDLRAVS